MINLKDALAQLEASKSSNKDLLKDFNWINEESGWVIESVEVKYVDISILVHYQEAHTLNSLKDKKIQ